MAPLFSVLCISSWVSPTMIGERGREGVEDSWREERSDFLLAVFVGYEWGRGSVFLLVFGIEGDSGLSNHYWCLLLP